MTLSRRIAGVAAGLACALGITLAGGPAASAHERAAATPTGTRSLATVLAPYGGGFDRSWNDYNIVTHAVLAVLAARPGSPVSVLTRGSTPLTAFLPTDRAFQRLVHDLTGKWVRSESDVFAAVAGLGIPTVETVLLYHVVPGATIDRKAALAANGARLTTAQGGTITVRVRCHPRRVVLQDRDPDARNPVVIRFDINRGNVQIAHGISRVLRPLDL